MNLEDQPAHMVLSRLGDALDERGGDGPVADGLHKLAVALHHYAEVLAGNCGPTFHEDAMKEALNHFAAMVGIHAPYWAWPKPDSIKGGHASVCGPGWNGGDS